MATGAPDNGTTQLGTGTLRITLGGVNSITLRTIHLTILPKALLTKSITRPIWHGKLRSLILGSGYQMVLPSDNEGAKIRFLCG